MDIMLPIIQEVPLKDIFNINLEIENMGKMVNG